MIERQLDIPTADGATTTYEHGFAFPQRPAYDKAAAERRWERLVALYRRRLG